MVVLGVIDHPEQGPNPMSNIWCSEYPNSTNLNGPSRISIANLYLKYWWFQNHPNVVGAPFSTSRQWLVDGGGVLAHEFGHSFIDCYVHYPGSCTGHLMNHQAPSWSNVLLEDDAGCIHRNLARSNLRQFVACDETYDPEHPKWNATTFDRIVSSDELWDLDMRLYSNVTVRTGATLTVTCNLLMPLEGMIKVERGDNRSSMEVPSAREHLFAFGNCGPFGSGNSAKIHLYQQVSGGRRCRGRDPSQPGAH